MVLSLRDSAQGEVSLFSCLHIWNQILPSSGNLSEKQRRADART